MISGLEARSRWLAALLLIAAGACSDPAAIAPEEAAVDASPASRNVILIVVDTLRADFLGSYGGDVPTPFLDGLAASGVRFERSYSHIPLTGPSHASFFTSGLPSDHGCVVNSQILDDANVTMAEILRDNGFDTAAIVSLGVLAGRFGFAQGFDKYFDRFPGRWWKSADEINKSLSNWLADSPPTGPTFLLLHYSDPHTPYAPPDEDYATFTLRHDGQQLATLPADSRPHRVPVTLAPGVNTVAFDLASGLHREDFGCVRVLASDRRVRFRFSDGGDFVDDVDGAPPFLTLPTAMLILNTTDAELDIDLGLTLRMNLGPERWEEWYAKEVAYVDGQIAAAVEALREAGLWEDSIIIFTSDHGEGLGEHGHMQHVEQLYDSMLRIPLIMVAPGQLPAGMVVDTPVRHVDILPTVLELVGLADTDAALPLRGSSLLPLIADRTAPRPPVVSETHTPEAKNDQRSIVYQDFKYIVNETTGAEELYSLANDPGELTDLADDRPDVLDMLRDLLAIEYERHYGPTDIEAGMAELSDEDRAQLEALGYLR